MANVVLIHLMILGGLEKELNFNPKIFCAQKFFVTDNTVYDFFFDKVDDMEVKKQKKTYIGTLIIIIIYNINVLVL